GPMPENIHRTSALVVIDFVGWPDGKADPVDLNEDQIATLKARNGFQGNAGQGLKEYVENLERRYGKGTPSPKKPA
ncbi:MAG: hypothetical protein Q7T55_07265, partial [Solirubrobacteraceae bacterium]|nr:hypothetical protein [Solirubrobacteraceae bacterium]